MTKNLETAQPCGTCPFLIENRGKPHAKGWYKPSNLKRLWNGLRTGKAPGLVCHSTDPNSPEYGNEKQPKAGCERQCPSANTLVLREVQKFQEFSDFKSYAAQNPDGLSKRGLGYWLDRIVFADTPIGAPFPIVNPTDQRIQRM